MKKLLTFLVCLFLVTAVFSQKEANIWHFGWYVGLDFKNDPPDTLSCNFKHSSVSSICDTEGNLLFTANGSRIINRTLDVMQNGSGLVHGGFASQGLVSVQKPGSENLYYVFGVPHQSSNTLGLYYSVIDMNADGGLGAVTGEKNVPLYSAWDACEKVLAVRHANNRDIWIITRRSQVSAYAAFLLTENGVEDTPVLSESPYRPLKLLRHCMKISYNKKYLIAAYGGAPPVSTSYETYDICRFDATTGTIDFMYTLDPNEFEDNESPNSVEFSPDSKLVYLNNRCAIQTSYFNIYQYDMSLIEDSAQFVNSDILITNEGGWDLQLARDGKIYTGKREFHPFVDSLSVIQKPWMRGAGCKYEEAVIHFKPVTGAHFHLPKVLLDYLYRFEWEGKCQSSPFVFQNNFQPTPVYISWNFGDPASGDDNFSQDLNPSHLFTAAGEYEVSVFVRYPSDRTEFTSRVVTVEDVPHPGLGPGYFICEGEEVSLYAGEEEGMYVWSTGEFGQNLNTITVSDSGLYWVQVTAEIGCFGIDSVYVVWYPKSEINEDNLILHPTACGGDNGAITGLTISGTEPLSY